MRPGRARYLVFGVLCSVLGAAGFSVVFLVVSGGLGEGLVSGLAQSALAIGVGLMLSSWFVIPIGLVLGLVFPRVALGRPTGRALIGGALVGLVLGVVVAACLTILYDLSTATFWLRLTVPYCLAGSVGATLWIRRLEPQRAAA